MLADRAAAQAVLDDPRALTHLVDTLRRIGAQAQAVEIIERSRGWGLFEFFREQDGRGEQYKFGREIDGSPARKWGWEDLD